MDSSRLTPGDLSAGIGGLVLLVSLWLNWYSVSVKVQGFSASASASGWETLTTIDIILFVVAVAAIVLVAMKAFGEVPGDVPVPVVLVALGGLAVLLVLFRLIDTPAPSDLPDQVDVDREFGVIIALIGAAGIAYGGWRANMEEPRARPAETTSPPPPPPAA